jgi:hypothetical protein
MERYRHQRNWGPRLREVQYFGLTMWIIENELIRLSVLSDKGTDICEFLYKPRDLDFVWLTAGGVRDPRSYLSTRSDPVSTFIDYYLGGWQEVFPNGGPPSEWAGAQFGQHGEVCNLPWDVAVIADDESEVALRMRVRTQKTPFAIEKTLRLRAGKPTLEIEERLTNESEVELPAMWGHHITFGRPFLAPGCRIRLPEEIAVVPHSEAIHPGGRRLAGTQGGAWPRLPASGGGVVDLSELPPVGEISEIVYLTGFRDAWYEVHDPERHIGMRVSWDAATMPYLWYWQEFGATKRYPWYGRHYNIGLEPFSSYPTGGLAEAVANGSAMTVPARGTKVTQLQATIFEGEA